MKYLIIGPGGLGFFGMLGCLTNLKEELKNVEEISGSSAGSLLGFLLLTNKSLEEIFDISLNINISELTKMNLNAFIKTFGFIDHELIKQKLIEIWGGNPRFKDLSKKFHVSAYCLNTLEVEYFSIDTNPDMYVIDAICASISVPFMFAAFNFNGKLYIDGGANEKIPALPFLNKKREDVLCVATRTFKSEHVEINSLHSFVRQIGNSILKHSISYNLPGYFIDISDFNTLDMNMSFDDKLKMFLFGYSFKKNVK